MEAPSKKTGGKRSVGQEIITSLKEAIAWAGREDVPVRVTTVGVPTTNVRALRRPGLASNPPR
jgi:hypothetical protein